MHHKNKPMTVRQAIKVAIHWNRVAQDTRNRELRANTREFIRNHWHLRNTQRLVLI